MHMTPGSFKQSRLEMGLSHEQMAFLLKSPVSDVEGWESGTIPITGPVERAIFLYKHCCDIHSESDGSVSYSNRYLKIAEKYGYKVPAGHEGPLPPQYTAWKPTSAS
jgi:hypothetical protein